MTTSTSELVKLLESCAAGDNFRSADNRKDVAEDLLKLTSNATIDASHPRIYHLQKCIAQCEALSQTNLWSDTYQQLILNLLANWQDLGNWTWVYRSLVDIAVMDDNLAAFNGCKQSPLGVCRARLLARVSRGLALGQIR